MQWHIAVVVRLPNYVKLEQCICEWDCWCTRIVHYMWSVL